MVYKKRSTVWGERRRSELLSIPFLLAGLLIIPCILTNCGIEEGIPEPPSSPEINSITPNRGPAGTSVLIEGSGFNPIATENVVTFNGEPAEVIAATPSSIEAFVPDSATTGPVAVTAREETATGPEFSVIIIESTLEVIVSTSGADLDTDGYEISLDGEAPRSIAIEDTLFFEDLNEGFHEIELLGVDDNCSVSDENPRLVDILTGESTSIAFEVICREILANKIAFSSDRDGNTEIYMMNPDGTNQTRLTNNSGSDENPAISPDGTRIAFDSDRDGNSNIYIMDSDGSNIVHITNSSTSSNSAPAWSPDGNRLVFTRSDANQASDIFIINTDGTGEINLTENLESSDAGAEWSPDGSQLAFMSNRDDDANLEIFLINPDGTGLTKLTNTGSGINNANPDWSPDGSQIAFATNRDQDYELYIMNTDGSNPSRLTNTMGADLQPSFSPDGTNISFYSARDGNAEIYRINVNGTGVTNLTETSANELSSDWSPVQ